MPKESKIVLKGGVEITVNHGGALKSANTAWMGCDMLWKGIVNKGRMLAIGGRFRDAFKAITLQRQNSYTPLTLLYAGVTFSNNCLSIV